MWKQTVKVANKQAHRGVPEAAGSLQAPVQARERRAARGDPGRGRPLLGLRRKRGALRDVILPLGTWSHEDPDLRSGSSRSWTPGCGFAHERVLRDRSRCVCSSRGSTLAKTLTSVGAAVHARHERPVSSERRAWLWSSPSSAGRRSGDRAHPRGRRAAHRAQAGGRRRRRGRLGDGRRDRRARRARAAAVPATRPSARWTCCCPPASRSRSRCWRWPSTRWATTPSPSPGPQVGIVTDAVHTQGQDHRGARRARPRGARRAARS